MFSKRGSQLSLARPSPVTHRSNLCTNEETVGGGMGTDTLPSMDSHCHCAKKGFQIILKNSKTHNIHKGTVI